MYPEIILYRILLSLAVCFTNPILPATTNGLFLKDFYKEGTALRETDEWEEALKVWWHGRNQLDLKGRIDPRLGIAFIELATEQKADKYYGTASEMYLWSFSRGVSAEFQKVVTQEAGRIIPLLDEDVAKAWQKLIKAKDASLSHKIRLFWLQKDSREKIMR